MFSFTWRGVAGLIVMPTHSRLASGHPSHPPMMVFSGGGGRGGITLTHFYSIYPLQSAYTVHFTYPPPPSPQYFTSQHVRQHSLHPLPSPHRQRLLPVPHHTIVFTQAAIFCKDQWNMLGSLFFAILLVVPLETVSSCHLALMICDRQLLPPSPRWRALEKFCSWSIK